MKITPSKLKDDSWGVRVVPPQELDRGTVVDVETRKGKPYKAVIRTRLWGNDEAELYAVDRLPDMPGDGKTCPMCHQEITGARKEPKRDTVTEWNKPRNSDVKTPNAEPDDDIPF